MAPSTPPPPARAELAALTMASTSCAVMSPWTSSRRDCLKTMNITYPLHTSPKRQRGRGDALPRWRFGLVFSQLSLAQDSEFRTPHFLHDSGVPVVLRSRPP